MADIFQSLDQQVPEVVSTVAERLEFRGSHAGFTAMRERYFDRLDLSDCHRILDLGCGTGVVTRALAARVGADTELVGSDLAGGLIDRAREIAAAEGLGDRIRFEVADSQGTPDRDAAYDVVIAHTLISHVSDPAALLAEATRLARPGGMIAVFDGDYASLTFGAGDPDMNQTVSDAINNSIVANARIMRRLPALARDLGLEIADFLPELLAETGNAAFFRSMIEAYIPIVVADGALAQDAAAEWAAGQTGFATDGSFFGACNYYTYLLRKPG